MLVAACALGVLLAGCPSEGLPACISLDTSCAPLYEPTFENVYTQTIARSCGGERSPCHAAGGDGNLPLTSRAQSYTALRARLTPGDPGCSDVIVRMHGAGEEYLMPPGAPLSGPERCAIAQWVEAGAAEVSP